MDISTLEALIAGNQDVTLDLSVENYPVFIVENAACTAKIALHGAHLFQWQPQGHDPVIYTSPNAILREGKAIRGGIPVCWPWFNAHPADASLPSHGFGRNRFWNLAAVESTGDSVTTLTFSLEAKEETKTIWPYDFAAKVIITVGTELTVALETTNTGNQEFTVGGALHTYLAVGNINEVSITGLENTHYLDTVGERTERVQEGAITIAEEVDRIYHGTTKEITLSDNKRDIIVSREGSSTAVVWNPWIEKAQGLGDLPDEAYNDFVCIEAANALDDVYPLVPGESHTLLSRIQVQ